MDIKVLLQKIVSRPLWHAKFLNTLSYLENCGAKLIAGSQHPSMVPKEILKHAAEEFRHAYYLKAQLKKIEFYGRCLPTYQRHELLGGHKAKHYLYRLNIEISRFLKEKNISETHLKEFGYLLVTYAIEKRAEQLYPLYQEVLQSMDSTVSVAGIIREELHHLAEISRELLETSANIWKRDVCQIELAHFTLWQRQTMTELAKTTYTKPHK
ncbi:MAG: hypothetical protein Tsb0015_14470 [Simkaniaceae bacterium]